MEAKLQRELSAVMSSGFVQEVMKRELFKWASFGSPAKQREYTHTSVVVPKRLNHADIGPDLMAFKLAEIAYSRRFVPTPALQEVPFTKTTICQRVAALSIGCVL